jgi:hypothetical protein
MGNLVTRERFRRLASTDKAGQYLAIGRIKKRVKGVEPSTFTLANALIGVAKPLPVFKFGFGVSRFAALLHR